MVAHALYLDGSSSRDINKCSLPTYTLKSKSSKIMLYVNARWVTLFVSYFKVSHGLVQPKLL